MLENEELELKNEESKLEHEDDGLSWMLLDEEEVELFILLEYDDMSDDELEVDSKLRKLLDDEEDII